MIQPATNGRRVFEVTLYNKDVRAAVKDNQSHTIYGDHWADIQIQDVMAMDAKEAMSLIGQRYPSDEGFVIEQLAEC